MKLKKLIFTISIPLLIIIALILSISINYKSKTYVNSKLIIGEKVNNNMINSSDYNDSFTAQNMSCSFLKKMIDEDASKIIDGKIVKLSKCIKKSSNIIINIGNYDMSAKISHNTYNNSLIYDYEILLCQIEINEDFLKQIIKSVQQINKEIKIYILSIKYPYSIKDEKLMKIYDMLNYRYEQITTKLYEKQDYIKFIQ
ncbi:MAG: hypothetical protein MR270_00200 [Erysipelotrichaceae bacterium]|nr:hypothetical protein [Erysipelotrichaceae bacterium]